MPSRDAAPPQTTRPTRPWSPPPRPGGRRPTSPPTPPAPLDAAAQLFDPAQYHYDPVSRCGLPYDLMRRCGCGGTQFQLIMRGEDTRCHVICQACYADWRFRLSRPDDVIYGHLDVARKHVTYNRPLPELVAMRAKLGAKS